jgi:hypothetical protein
MHVILLIQFQLEDSFPQPQERAMEWVKGVFVDIDMMV